MLGRTLVLVLTLMIVERVKQKVKGTIEKRMNRKNTGQIKSRNKGETKEKVINSVNRKMIEKRVQRKCIYE